MTKDLAEKGEDRFAQFESPAHEGSNFESRREIRLCGPSSSAGEIEEGHYYIVDFNKGDDVEYTDLGEEIEVYILRDCMRLRKWNDEEKRNDYDSTEFRSFKDIVVLYDNTTEKTSIRSALPYTHNNDEAPKLKEVKEELGLRVRYFAYVLYQDEVFRMSFAATDNAGADSDEKPMGFDSPAADSFMGLKKEANTYLKDRLFMFKVKLGSMQLQTGETKDKKPIYSKKMRPKTFTLDKQIESKWEETVVYDQLVKLYKELADQMWNKYTGIREEEQVRELDEWSKKVLENIDGTGPDLTALSESGSVMEEPDVKDAEVVDVAEQAKTEFPPSEEVIAKQKQKVKDMSTSTE